MRIKYQSHTLDKQKNEMMIYPGLIFAKYLAVKLQTLAEKMTNTIYRAAKVCSFTARSWQRYIHLFSLLFI